MKKSFILHRDSLDILDELTDEQSGKLFKAIKDFQNGVEPELDSVLKMVFVPFRNQFLRDDKNYENRCEVNRANGSKGGKQKLANATKRKQPQANLADSDNDNDNVNDIDNDSEIVSKVNPDKLPFFFSWLEYRKSIKKPITVQQTLEQLVNRLNTEPIEKVKFVVNSSIENGWQGLFWDKIHLPNQPKPVKRDSPI